MSKLYLLTQIDLNGYCDYPLYGELEKHDYMWLKLNIKELLTYLKKISELADDYEDSEDYMGEAFVIPINDYATEASSIVSIEDMLSFLNEFKELPDSHKEGFFYTVKKIDPYPFKLIFESIQKQIDCSLRNVRQLKKEGKKRFRKLRKEFQKRFN